MTSSVSDHPILDDINEFLKESVSIRADMESEVQQWTRKSECIEFQDASGDWFDIVVRQIEEDGLSKCQKEASDD